MSKTGNSTPISASAKTHYGWFYGELRNVTAEQAKICRAIFADWCKNSTTYNNCYGEQYIPAAINAIGDHVVWGAPLVLPE